MKYLAMGFIHLYQITLGKVLPPSCRFEPSCSAYGYQALEKHGFFKGGWLGIKRIIRCHPLNPGGYDPIP